jgi:hypothetical protein
MGIKAERVCQVKGTAPVVEWIDDEHSVAGQSDGRGDGGQHFEVADWVFSRVNGVN